MINEQQQELACLYVLGALPPEEAKALESALAKDEALQKFVRELGGVTSLLAVSAPPIELPANFKEKILGALPAIEKENIARPDFRPENSPRAISWAWLPWAAAACVALAAIAFYQKNSSLKKDFALLSDQSAAQRQQLSLVQTELADLKAKDRLSQMRNRSMALLRVMVAHQLNGFPTRSSNCAALSQIWRKTSCKASSASFGSLRMRTVRE